MSSVDNTCCVLCAGPRPVYMLVKVNRGMEIHNPTKTDRTNPEDLRVVATTPANLAGHAGRPSSLSDIYQI